MGGVEVIPPLAVRPRFRGVVHQWSFFVALAAHSSQPPSKPV